MAIIENKYRIGVKYVNQNRLLTLRGIILLLEDLACRHSDMVGFGINDTLKTNLSWVLLNWKIKILKEANYGSTVTVKTWSRDTNKLYTYRDFEIYDEKNNLICIASSKWVLLSTKTGHITQITDEIRNAYNPENKTVFEEPEISKLIEPSNANETFSFRVNRRDIDINNHMNNLYYLDYALEALPEDVYLKKFKNVEITYKNSSKLGDIVNCFYKEQEDGYYVVMKSETSKILYAIIKLC